MALKNYQRFFSISFALLICLLSFLVIRPLITPILSAIILAYLFYPVYRWFQKVLHKLPEQHCLRWAALCTVIAITLVFLAPAFTLIAILWSNSYRIEIFFNNLLPRLLEGNAVIQNFLVSGFWRDLGIEINLGQSIGLFSSLVLRTLQNIFTQTPVVVLGAFVSLFLVYALLRNARTLLALCQDMLPLSQKQCARIAKNFDGLGRGVIVSQLLIAVTQGVLIGLACLILQLPHGLLLSLLTCLFAVVPFLGAIFIWLSIFVYLLITAGLSWQAIFMFFYGSCIISSVDNIIRPKILADNSQINPALTLIGFIGGFMLFGLPGIFIGPFILATMEIALEIFKQLD